MRNSSSDVTRTEARITGRVQGVGFRYSTMERARRLGVHGWVCNAPDVSVDLVAQGHQADVDQLVSWLRTGPSSAHVADVELTNSTARGLTGFEIRHDCR